MTLTQAILYGDCDQVSFLLQSDHPVNYLDEYGYTPLIECVIRNDIEKAKLLLNKNADVNQLDMTGRSALFWAVFNQNTELAELLLEKGANPNAYTIASEPILARPLLRHQDYLKQSLIQHGAKLSFAQDFINAKLLGHRYELIGSVDILDPKGFYTEVDYEGFYLEFALELICASLVDFRSHYVAKHLQSWFLALEKITHSLLLSRRLVEYDHYLSDYRQHLSLIRRVLSEDPVVIPINQEAHAFSIVRSGSLLAICDRNKEEGVPDKIPIYYMNRPSYFKTELLAPMIYQKQDIKIIRAHLQKELGLHAVMELPLPSQRIGNCSWANIEAVIPVLFLMQQMNEQKEYQKELGVTDALELFHRWREWDRRRAVHFFIQEMADANEARRASHAALLAGVLFQTCSVENHDDVERAKRIIQVIKRYGYDFIFKSYVQTYLEQKPTQAGRNLQKLLEIYEREEKL